MNIEKTIREDIENVIHMSLATCRDIKPWICEVHFSFDNDLNFYFLSKPERRHSEGDTPQSKCLWQCHPRACHR